MANFLAQKDPLGLSVGAGDKYQTLAKNLLAYRDTEKNGVLTNFAELVAGAAVPRLPLVSAMKDNYYTCPLRHSQRRDRRRQGRRRAPQSGIRVTLYALAGMLVYIAFRFYGGQIGGSTGWAAKGAIGFVLRFMDRIIFGVAAVLAVFHDVLITLGLFQDFRI